MELFYGQEEPMDHEGYCSYRMLCQLLLLVSDIFGRVMHAAEHAHCSHPVVCEGVQSALRNRKSSTPQPCLRTRTRCKRPSRESFPLSVF